MGLYYRIWVCKLQKFELEIELAFNHTNQSWVAWYLYTTYAKIERKQALDIIQRKKRMQFQTWSVMLMNQAQNDPDSNME